MTVKKRKVTLNIRIDEDLYKELIEIAPRIYGKYRGGVSYIIGEAVKQYLASLRQKAKVVDKQ